LAREADIVSVHVALKPDTRLLIGPDFFRSMREGAYLINTSRGEVVDQTLWPKRSRRRESAPALMYSPSSRRLRSPSSRSNCEGTGVYGTHHIGASTDQAQEAMPLRQSASSVIQGNRTSAERREPRAANPGDASSGGATSRSAGVLAQVLDAIKAEHINVQEMENIVFEGAEAAVARINLDKAPSQATLDRLSAGNEDIIELDLLELKI